MEPTAEMLVRRIESIAAENLLLKNRLGELALMAADLEAEVAALNHALTVAQGQLRLMHQDRDFTIAA